MATKTGLGNVVNASCLESQQILNGVLCNDDLRTVWNYCKLANSVWEK